MTRTETHRLFTESFASSYHEASIPSHSDVILVEQNLSRTFPRSYIDFITKYGAVYTPSILDLVTGGENEEAPEDASFDVQNFIELSSLIDEAKAHWEAGMSDTMIPIASDCMGNLFGFARQTNETRPADLPVLVFDHDFGTIENEHDSFDSWLKSFLDMKTALA
ncbi:SMI1/KNR4 family protein [Persicirhabdus sediminis]|uniref:SMI1/KNR4 family protein n=1 Tax=Persicirhabdus sediminis TaxID=454144 RepID=A0A8J7MFA3_9BACT|nr:SMI1/KNR4 family protein [Persicirhabdus sediminis]MBK1791633.1 SMI1/KNR4 family protein [Persicirhabdus sediminis]